MADTELVIKINGDIKNFTDALDKAKSSTEDLEDSLKTTAEVSGVAFAALTAAIGVTVSKYAEHESAVRSLTLALQNQGLYSKELLDNYNDQAEAISKLTGIDKDSIAAGQTRLQQIIGQVPITKELTQAMVELSTRTGSVEGAAQLLGRAIETSTTSLKRQGVVVIDSVDKQTRLERIIAAVNTQLGGQAEAANKGLGGINGLKTAFGEFEKAIGEKFAPMMTVAIEKATEFFKELTENKALISFIAEMLKFGAELAGVALAISTASIAFLNLRAAMIAAGGAMELLSLGVKALLSPTGIGLLLVIAGEIYTHWNVIWPAMVSAFKAFAQNVSEMAYGLGEILIGALSFDKETVVKGWNDLSAALKKTWAETKLAPIEAPVVDTTKQDAARKANSDERTAEELRLQKIKNELDLATRQERFLIASGASKDIVDLKKREIETLKAMEKETDSNTLESLKANLAVIHQLQANAAEDFVQNANTYYGEILENNKQYQELSFAEKEEFREKNKTALIASLEDEKQVRERYALQEAQIQIAAHNKFLLEQKKFGTSYATINKLIGSEQFAGAVLLTNSLISLQQSGNATLKSIGKIAAVADITIRTARGAMAAYEGAIEFLGPIFGPPVGIAAAAAMVAFGGEQIGNVMGAAEGGLISGGLVGRDSVPLLAQQGELVAPRQNFEEVIGSVAATRAAEQYGGGGGVTEVVIGFQGDAAELLETKFLARRRTGVGVI